jgi:hypothetical protein
MEPTQPHSNGSLGGPDDARRLRASIEALSNLIYLASREAEDPERVRTYLKLAEKQVAALGHTLGRKSASMGRVNETPYRISVQKRKDLKGPRRLALFCPV